MTLYRVFFSAFLVFTFLVLILHHFSAWLIGTTFLFLVLVPIFYDALTWFFRFRGWTWWVFSSANNCPQSPVVGPASRLRYYLELKAGDVLAAFLDACAAAPIILQPVPYLFFLSLCSLQYMTWWGLHQSTMQLALNYR